MSLEELQDWMAGVHRTVTRALAHVEAGASPQPITFTIEELQAIQTACEVAGEL